MAEGFTDVDEELIVSAIGFPGNRVLEVQFAEKRDNSDSAGLTKSLWIDIGKAGLDDQFDELITLTRELIDGGLLSIRNPPQKRTRFRATAPIADDNDDD